MKNHLRIFPDNVNVDGYRQSPKYFNHIEDILREDFTFKDDILEPCQEFIKDYGNDIIFLHVRRSDSTGRSEYFQLQMQDILGNVGTFP